ncbi:MAG: Hint domain-containing protein [Pseudomonadota bacterium]
MADITGSDDIGGTNQSAENTFDNGKFYYEWIELTTSSGGEPGPGGIANLTQAGFDTSDGSLLPGTVVYNAGTTDELSNFASNDPTGLASNASASDLGNSGENFAIRVSTVLTVENGGNFAFTSTSDDGFRLYVDGVELIDEDGRHAPRSETENIFLGPGDHEITIIYFENTGQNVLAVEIQGLDGAPQDYPTRTLLDDANVQANRGDDVFNTGEGEDVVDAGAGDDVINTGAGDDVIIASVGSDMIDGGSDVGDGDNDVLDLTQLVPGTFDLVKDPSNPEAGQVIFKDPVTGMPTGEVLTYTEIEEIICFTEDTLIATPQGDVWIGDLAVGDRVLTRDNGPQFVRWIGSRRLFRHELAVRPHLAPITIRAGALGAHGPARDLAVSPQHKMLVTHPMLELVTTEGEAFAKAKHLIGIEGVFQSHSCDVCYYHILFDRHEVILANGAWTESFLPGAYNIGSMEPRQQSELYDIFPELKVSAAPTVFSPSRLGASKRELSLLHDTRFRQSQSVQCLGGIGIGPTSKGWA